ncbi:DUF4381 domain-containing protein [Paracoccaceae bacterium]|nr:DUF4381 domain-containing protein [Paracoccaceae bacterium]
MTPNDLIADLRDIHTPEVVHETAMLLSPYPLIAFAVLLAAGLWWSHRRATNWRREGAKRLVEVTRITDPVKRLAELIALFQKVARRSEAGPAPDYLYQPMNRLGSDADQSLVAEIERRLR